MATRAKVAKTTTKKKVAAKKSAAGKAVAKPKKAGKGLTPEEADRLRALPAAFAEPVDFPVSDVSGEARALIKVFAKERARLLKYSDLTPKSLTDLRARKSLLDRSEWAWTWARQRSASVALRAARAKAESLERPMLAALKHFLRKNADVMTRVRAIEVGTGDEDTIDDLLKLADLFEAHSERLVNAEVPPGVVGKARKAAEALSEAADASEVDDAPTAARLLRNRAYWHLRELMDFVREEGRYAFRDMPEKLVHFRATSTRAAEGRSSKKKKGEDEETPPK